MINPLSKLKEECNKILENAVSQAYPKNKLPKHKFSYPPNLEMGDISSTISFQLSRTIGIKASKVAEKIIKYVDLDSSNLVESVKAIGGYINFFADIGNFTKLVLESTITQNSDYGFIKSNKPEKIMVEHTSANPNGPIHIGNARNSILGACLAEMLKRKGHDLAIHFLVNDMGRQVAMATYGWRLLGKPKPEGRPELWVGTIYASVNVVKEMIRLKKELKDVKKKGGVNEIVEIEEELKNYEAAANELKKRNTVFETLDDKLPQIKDPLSEIARLNTEYENNEPNTSKDVRNLVGYCLNGFETSLGEIGITFDSFDFESDLVWRKAADEVLEDLRSTQYVYEDKGALILDCNKIADELNLKERWGLHPEHEIPQLVLVRSDGTTLYTLRDIAYSIWKFGFVDRVINVIGSEQTLAQLQLRIALAALGKIWMGDNQIHYSYELVHLPGVKMSGRLGRYVTLIEVIERAIELAFEEVTKRSPHLSEVQRREIARIVGHGAVKYTLLSVDPMKAVVFDWEKALNFETNSAPFIQYSHARACNILKKAEFSPEPDYSALKNVKERDLIMMIAKFPGIFEDAVSELKPGEITSYANNLADKFNSFYATLPVLRAESQGLVGARLGLVDSVRIVLRNATSLLGIEAPERM